MLFYYLQNNQLNSGIVYKVYPSFKKNDKKHHTFSLSFLFY